jgi:Raf kinase inhibitor-like YbhB/YbcL family protein
MMKRIPLALALCTLACGTATAMSLTSSDIAPGAQIAAAQIYPRCGGQNISPELSWSGAPAGTKSIALTMIDSDVKPSQWSHWIVENIPPTTTELARGVAKLPQGAQTVASNFGDPFYDGPCPPPGTGVHHYQITVWALRRDIVTLVPNAKATDISKMLRQLALDRASLTGWVKR